MSLRFDVSHRRVVALTSLVGWAASVSLPVFGGGEPLNTVFIRSADTGAPNQLAVYWAGQPTATLSVWLDFNGDGAWQDSEQVVDEGSLAEEMRLFEIASPTDIELAAQTPMRLQVSMDGALLRDVVRSLAGTPAPAGCWSQNFHIAGMDAQIDALAVFDDGSGPALYAGGSFTSANGQLASRIAKWDGEAWSAFGTGMDGPIRALLVFDDGSGPALYVGGNFQVADGTAVNRIAKWDGETWSALGTGMDDQVDALAVFDDGGGPALYAGGGFSMAGGVSASHIAKWDGATWAPLGAGTDNDVQALVPFDDGDGPVLYVGGFFDTAGGAFTSSIAAWDGTTWSALGGGLEFCDDYYGCGTGAVRALTVWDDGTGSALYVGGAFTHAGGGAANNIARWDGLSWSALGVGMGRPVFALASYDNGSGSELYAGADFNGITGDPLARIAKWNGSAWSALDNGADEGVHAFAVFDDGGGLRLYVGGDFNRTGDVNAYRIATWDGSSWAALTADAYGLNDWASTLTEFDDGSGPALYAGGVFTRAGDVVAGRVAKWDGASWAPLGTGIGTSLGGNVSALAVFDDGHGSELYVGGSFSRAGGEEVSRIAKWDGSAWSDVGGGTGSPSDWVYALTVFDDGDGPALYAGGDFFSMGGVNSRGIARWDGASWSAVGTGTTGTVLALTVFDDGTGPALYAGGDFPTAGGVATGRIAQWDGTAWSALGSGIDEDRVFALTTYDDGTGQALYVGGDFSSAGGVTVNGVAKWDGVSWSALASGVDTGVSALVSFDAGDGPALYAGGSFTIAGGVPANGLASWNGASWAPLDDAGGMNDGVRALAVHDDGRGPALFAVGRFTTAGGNPSSFVARFSCALFADGFESGDLSAWSNSVP